MELKLRRAPGVQVAERIICNIICHIAKIDSVDAQIRFRKLTKANGFGVHTATMILTYRVTVDYLRQIRCSASVLMHMDLLKT